MVSFSSQLFSSTHQWVASTDQADEVVIGISQYAEEALGDIVFVELPEAGLTLKAGEVIGSIESVKTASEIKSPVSGTLLACNLALEDDPERLNEAPLVTWIYRLQVKPKKLAREKADLLDTEAYARLLETF